MKKQRKSLFAILTFMLILPLTFVMVACAGADGNDGAAGTQITFGETQPAVTNRADGDLHFMTNGNVYRMTAGAWVLAGTQQGQQGQQGPIGPQGPTGPQGTGGVENLPRVIQAVVNTEEAMEGLFEAIEVRRNASTAATTAGASERASADEAIRVEQLRVWTAARPLGVTSTDGVTLSGTQAANLLVGGWEDELLTEAGLGAVSATQEIYTLNNIFALVDQFPVDVADFVIANSAQRREDAQAFVSAILEAVNLYNELDEELREFMPYSEELTAAFALISNEALAELTVQWYNDTAIIVGGTSIAVGWTSVGLAATVCDETMSISIDWESATGTTTAANNANARGAHAAANAVEFRIVGVDTLVELEMDRSGSVFQAGSTAAANDRWSLYAPEIVDISTSGPAEYVIQHGQVTAFSTVNLGDEEYARAWEITRGDIDFAGSVMVLVRGTGLDSVAVVTAFNIFIPAV
jgi:hypothetical protein